MRRPVPAQFEVEVVSARSPPPAPAARRRVRDDDVAMVMRFLNFLSQPAEGAFRLALGCACSANCAAVSLAMKSSTALSVIHGDELLS